MGVALNLSSIVDVNPGVLLGDVEGDIIALNMETEAYLHLNGSGSFIFGCLNRAGALSVVSLCEAVGQEYEVGEATCRQETAEFVGRCLELGLLRICDVETGVSREGI